SRAPTRPMSGSFPSNINFFKMHQQFINQMNKILFFTCEKINNNSGDAELLAHLDAPTLHQAIGEWMQRQLRTQDNQQS
ncbi:hypothetical protein, partial [Burkholderia ubonensis]|uniref:hypothetical protein n=1 Tax=Burkholderia ubonensis TaxID=101571 RepID=UPI001E5D3724